MLDFDLNSVQFLFFSLLYFVVFAIFNWHCLPSSSDDISRMSPIFSHGVYYIYLWRLMSGKLSEAMFRFYSNVKIHTLCLLTIYSRYEHLHITDILLGWKWIFFSFISMFYWTKYIYACFEIMNNILLSISKLKMSKYFIKNSPFRCNLVQNILIDIVPENKNRSFFIFSFTKYLYKSTKILNSVTFSSIK